MSNKLSFSVAINLLTENFKRGTNTVNGALRSMQMQVLTFAAALGAGGLGLSNFVSRFIDVAKETNRVTTALKNVSGSSLEYAQNQRYLLDIAKKYGLEINSLTGNFAKFTASATNAGVTMANQKKIFESVSRANAAFALSGDESNGVMLALSQMMGKGKISSEELRKQMGEKLPVAMAAMAKAAGTSIGGLEKLLKQGKLMSADILPKFADALNEMIPNIDTNNLETSLNKLKNTFTAITSDLGTADKYKALVDGLNTLLQVAAKNLKNIVVGIVAAIGFVVTRGLTKVYGEYAATGQRIVANATATHNRLRAAIAARVEAEIALEKLRSQNAIANDTQRYALREKIEKAEQALSARTTQVKVAHENAKAAAAKAAAVKSSGAWLTAGNAIWGSMKKIGASIKSMWNTFAPAVIVSALIAIIGHFRNIYTESKRIKNIFADYKRESANIADTGEITTLKTQLAIMNSKTKSQSEINAAQSALQKLLGKEGLSQVEINKLVKARIELLKDAAKAAAAFSTVGDYTERNARLAANVGLETGQMDSLAKLKPANGASKQVNENYFQAVRQEMLKNADSYKGNTVWEVDKALEEYMQNLRVISDATGRASKYQQNANKLTNFNPDTDGNDKETPLEKAQKKYAKALEELAAKREIEKMTVSDYNKALDELNKQHYIEARGSLDKDILGSDHFKTLQAAVASPQYDKNQAEFEKVQKEYSEELKKLTIQKKNGVLTDEQFSEELKNLTKKTSLAAGAIENIGIAGQAYIAGLQFNAMMLKKNKEIKPDQRDATFDYKKSETDILGEKLKIAEKYRDELRQAIKDGAKDLDKELDSATGNVKTLGDALKIREVRDDIKNLERDLNEGLYSGVKDIASSSDRVVNAFSNLRDVMNDVDASGWEKIMSVWNTLTTTIDSFLSVIKMIEMLTEVTKKLTEAKQEEANVEIQTAAVKVASAATGIAADTSAATTKVTTATTEVAANTAVAASEGGKSASKLPFPANLIAIGASIAAIIGMFAALPKFATGGIVPGGSYIGDNVLAGVNSGEMILNHGQQSKLFKAIDSGQLGKNNSNIVMLDSRVRGGDIILAINNTLSRSGKKSLMFK